MTDLATELNALLEENSHWADEELRLIQAIRHAKLRLAALPDIIKALEAEKANATAKMNETGQRADALLAEIDAAEEAARRHAWHGGNL